VGGYNPLFWDSSNSFKATYDSFLFSFTNRNNLHSAKLSYSKGDQYSLGCHSNCGPYFGAGCDLYFNNNHNWYSSGNSGTYIPRVDMPIMFSAEDYEVFQVIKK